jgi:hypothetical protein
MGGATVPELERELRRRLTRLVSGEEDLRSFQSWFVPTFWDESRLDPSAVRLAQQVELVISEYTSGAWTLDEAKEHLRGLLGVPVVEALWLDSGLTAQWVVAEHLVPWNTGTASRVILSSRVPQGPEAEDLEEVDIRYEAVHG